MMSQDLECKLCFGPISLIATVHGMPKCFIEIGRNISDQGAERQDTTQRKLEGHKIRIVNAERYFLSIITY